MKKSEICAKRRKISRIQPDCRQKDRKGQSNVTFSLSNLYKFQRFETSRTFSSLPVHLGKNVESSRHISFLLLNHFFFYIRVQLYAFFVLKIMKPCNLNSIKEFSDIGYKIERFYFKYQLFFHQYLCRRKHKSW